MDKAAQRAIGAALDGAELGGELIQDEIGPAVYRLEPTGLTVAACDTCHYVGLIPTIPRKPSLVWTCGNCGRKHALQPPARVWLEGNRPVIQPAPAIH